MSVHFKHKSKFNYPCIFLKAAPPKGHIWTSKGHPWTLTIFDKIWHSDIETHRHWFPTSCAVYFQVLITLNTKGLR